MRSAAKQSCVLGTQLVPGRHHFIAARHHTLALAAHDTAALHPPPPVHQLNLDAFNRHANEWLIRNGGAIMAARQCWQRQTGQPGADATVQYHRHPPARRKPYRVGEAVIGPETPTMSRSSLAVHEPQLVHTYSTV